MFYFTLLTVIVCVCIFAIVRTNKYIKIIALTILVLLSMNISVYRVNNDLMSPNYLINDVLVCYNTQFSIFGQPILFWFNVPILKSLIAPQRYDVVVIRRRHKTKDRYYIKRVFGFAGEEIVIENGDIFINGTIVFVTPIVNKQYVYEHYKSSMVKIIQFNKDFSFKGIVPDGCMLMLSDRRSTGWGDHNYYSLHDIHSIPILKISAIFDWIYFNRFMMYLYNLCR